MPVPWFVPYSPPPWLPCPPELPPCDPLWFEPPSPPPLFDPSLEPLWLESPELPPPCELLWEPLCEPPCELWDPPCELCEPPCCEPWLPLRLLVCGPPPEEPPCEPRDCEEDCDPPPPLEPPPEDGDEPEEVWPPLEGDGIDDGIVEELVVRQPPNATVAATSDRSFKPE